MNAGGECADKGEDNDCARSVGVPQEEVNCGCESGSDALEATECLGEIERRGVNDSHHLEGRDDRGERDLHPCGDDVPPMARRVA